ncbi:MFS transporter [Paraburkholderia xenovorans]
MALACGLIAASSYLAQPLIVFIGPKVGLPLWGASLVITLSQAGYCFGLVLLAPLGDLLENRRLVLLTLTGLCVALTVMAGANNAVLLLVAAFSLGVGTTAVQMLIPLAAHMTDDASRGRVVGKITGGLLAGIMLARPVASVAENVVGWRGLYILDAVIFPELDQSLKMVKIASIEMVCVVPHGHPLARRKRVVPADLEPYPLIGLSSLARVSTQIATAFRDAGVPYRVAVETRYSETACRLVGAGAGVAVVDALSAVAHTGQQPIVALPFRPKNTIDAWAISSKDRPLTRLAEALLVETRDAIKALRP